MDVELNDRISRPRAGIGYIDRDVERARDFCRRVVELQVLKGERGVAEAVAEGVQRRASYVPIARDEVRSIFRSLRAVVAVVERFLARAARPSHREVARRIGIAEQDIG